MVSVNLHAGSRQSGSAAVDRLKLTIQRLVDADIESEERTSNLLSRLEATSDLPEAEKADALRRLANEIAQLLERGVRAPKPRRIL